MVVCIIFRGILSVKDNNHHKQDGDLWVEDRYQVTHYRRNSAEISVEFVSFSEVLRVHTWFLEASISLLGAQGEKVLSV